MHTEIGRETTAGGLGIFTADETARLNEFFAYAGVQRRRLPRVISLPELVEEDAALAESVAVLALEVVQQRLPQWACYKNGKLVFARKLKPARARRVVVAPRHLFTINWADSGPGFPWPEAYHATFVPGFDRYVVTASRDSDDLYGCCDNAIGWFDAKVDWKEGSLAIVESWWTVRLDFDLPAWVAFLDAGSVSEADANALRDAVWPEEEEESEVER